MAAHLSVAAILLSGMVSNSLSLEPEGKWKLDARETSCVLQHEFSGNGQTWSAALLPQPGSPRIELLLTQRAPQKNRRTGDKASLTIRPSGTVFQGDVQTTAMPDGAVAYHIWIDTSLLVALPETIDMEIAVDRSPAIVLPLPGMAAAAAALGTCEQDLLASWGVDPSRFRPAFPLSKVSGFPTSADYPPGASGASGRVALLLELSSTGKVTGCGLIESSGNAVLDRQTCNIALSRMHFAPLRDADGKPIGSWTTFRFRWTAPPDPN